MLETERKRGTGKLRPRVRGRRSAPEGTIFDIQRFSLHDGRGIRTLVYMKGCPLRCAWCSNPESQRRTPEIMFYGENCIGCGACRRVCPFGDAPGNPDAPGDFSVPRDLCVGCGRCAEVCWAEARKIAGRRMSVGQVFAVIERDAVFYRESGGGVTVGGGEPAYQAPFVAALLARCGAKGIHTAVETCGQSAWKNLRTILAHTDLLLFDIKHLDPDAHRRMTGAANERILDNARRAERVVKEMIVRFPLVPGFNDDPGHVRALGAFVRENLPGVKRVDLLPYHSVGESKCARLSRTYALSGLPSVATEKLRETESILKSCGLSVVVGG
jgi:pyruvate formate lyase activating enzyme